MPPVTESRLRVRYAETDNMGVVYYANYLVWMEVGRLELCRACGLNYREMESEDGIYLAVAGPSYETPAELAMMRRWGADAVGMSTVAEVTIARQAGLRVLGVAAIANAAGGGPVSHAAVLRATESLGPRFRRLIRRIIQMCPAEPGRDARP